MCIRDSGKGRQRLIAGRQRDLRRGPTRPAPIAQRQRQQRRAATPVNRESHAIAGPAIRRRAALLAVQPGRRANRDSRPRQRQRQPRDPGTDRDHQQRKSEQEETAMQLLVIEITHSAPV